MIGGNTAARVMRDVAYKDKAGVPVKGEPEKAMDVTGWLDYTAGQVDHGSYKSQVQDSTHVFVSDYDPGYAALSERGLFLSIGGKRYDVLLIDDPMELHEHIETYLKYVGVV